MTTYFHKVLSIETGTSQKQHLHFIQSCPDTQIISLKLPFKGCRFYIIKEIFLRISISKSTIFLVSKHGFWMYFNGNKCMPRLNRNAEKDELAYDHRIKTTFPTVNINSVQLLLYSWILCKHLQRVLQYYNMFLWQFFCDFHILSHLLQLSHWAKMSIQLRGCVFVLHLSLD